MKGTLKIVKDLRHVHDLFREIIRSEKVKASKCSHELLLIEVISVNVSSLKVVLSLVL